ncbi:MAG: hypothetical protein JKY80_01925 [Mariprofundaceae bacterium]|nr:hypothetical protein [Methylophaga sp.]MBL4759598.1 hypothetical protein [Mariprofundaceae bacterium]
MSVISMQADSTSVVLNGVAITDFGEGDTIELNPVNALTSHVNSANGGVNINKRNDANVHDMILRVQKFSGSDVFLNSAINQGDITIFNGSAKEDFTRDGNAAAEAYTLENGSITVQPSNVKNNTDGNALMEYTIRFRNAFRNI